jgi:uncharacterized membrane protein YeiH
MQGNAESGEETDGGTMKFLMDIFKEDDGKASLSRVMTALFAVFACYWVTYLVRKNGAMPDFTGLILFISMAYGLNQAARLAANVLASKTAAAATTTGGGS